MATVANSELEIPQYRKFQGIMQRKKIDFFLADITPGERVLEIGSGSSWVARYLKRKKCNNYVGIDIAPPADVVGDIRDWKKLGLKPNSFDVIIAFEVLEHVNCVDECRELLSDGGRLLVTTPVPHFDWLLWLLEKIGLNQKRTSPHNNLLYLNSIVGFSQTFLQTKFGMSQWGVFVK